MERCYTGAMRIMKRYYVIYSAAMILIYCIGSRSWRYRDNPPAAVTVLAFLLMLTVVAFMDMRTREIADECHVIILMLAGISCFTMSDISLLSRGMGAVCVSMPMLLITLAIPGAFGGGDIKLMAVCGAFLGGRITIVSTGLGMILGGIWGIDLMAFKGKERKEAFAFAPCLCLGMAAGIFAGEGLLRWYLG